MEDQFLTEPKSQPTYPLDLMLCKNCGFVFLKQQIEPEASYTNYIYNTDVTVGLSDHYKDYASNLVSRFSIEENALAVDVGSNDGTMVAALQTSGMRAIGVEPAKSIADSANQCGRQTINAYFSSSVSDQIIDGNGNADLITANYMFANVPDLDSFLDGINRLLSKNGVFVVQTGYHPVQFCHQMFDYTYHEHFYYFTVASLYRLFDRHGLQIIDVELQSPKGGSMRIFAAKKAAKKVFRNSFINLIKSEKNNGWLTQRPFVLLREKIDQKRIELHSIFSEINRNENTIVGFGASHSTTTLTYELELGQYINFLVDDNPAKHGTYSPGLHIPVFPVQKIIEKKPKAVIILAWQHADSIMKKHKFLMDSTIDVITPFSLPEMESV